MLLLVEKILALVPFNGAFSHAPRQVVVSIFVLKMVTRASMLLILANRLSSPAHAAASSATMASRDSRHIPTDPASAEFLLS